MANRIKNGTEYTKVVNRGNRAKGSLAVRTLRNLAFRTQLIAANWDAVNKAIAAAKPQEAK